MKSPVCATLKAWAAQLGYRSDDFGKICGQYGSSKEECLILTDNAASAQILSERFF
jgi:hypothetical protein